MHKKIITIIITLIFLIEGTAGEGVFSALKDGDYALRPMASRVSGRISVGGDTHNKSSSAGIQGKDLLTNVFEAMLKDERYYTVGELSRSIGERPTRAQAALDVFAGILAIAEKDKLGSYRLTRRARRNSGDVIFFLSERSQAHGKRLDDNELARTRLMIDASITMHGFSVLEPPPEIFRGAIEKAVQNDWRAKMRPEEDPVLKVLNNKSACREIFDPGNAKGRESFIGLINETSSPEQVKYYIRNYEPFREFLRSLSQEDFVKISVMVGLALARAHREANGATETDFGWIMPKGKETPGWVSILLFSLKTAHEEMCNMGVIKPHEPAYDFPPWYELLEECVWGAQHHPDSVNFLWHFIPAIGSDRLTRAGGKILSSRIPRKPRATLQEWLAALRYGTYRGDSPLAAVVDASRLVPSPDDYSELYDYLMQTEIIPETLKRCFNIKCDKSQIGRINIEYYGEGSIRKVYRVKVFSKDKSFRPVQFIMKVTHFGMDDYNTLSHEANNMMFNEILGRAGYTGVLPDGRIVRTGLLYSGRTFGEWLTDFYTKKGNVSAQDLHNMQKVIAAESARIWKAMGRRFIRDPHQRQFVIRPDELGGFVVELVDKGYVVAKKGAPYLEGRVDVAGGLEILHKGDNIVGNTTKILQYMREKIPQVSEKDLLLRLKHYIRYDHDPPYINAAFGFTTDMDAIVEGVAEALGQKEAVKFFKACGDFNEEDSDVKTAVTNWLSKSSSAGIVFDITEAMKVIQAIGIAA